MNDLLPCPFCGHLPDLDDPDTLHPSGLFWRYIEEWDIKKYIRFKDRQEGDKACYVFNCVEHYGGCGVELHADSREECIEKWNTRHIQKTEEWSVREYQGKVFIVSGDFEHDEMMTLTGDYSTKTQKLQYAQSLCDKLNRI